MTKWRSAPRKVVAYSLLLVIVVGSFLPPHDMSLIQLPGNDKVHHATMYMLLTFSFLWPYRRRSLRSWWRVIVPIWFMGAIIEPLQPIISPGRECDIYDLLANSSGIAVAILMVIFWQRFTACRADSCVSG